MFVKSIVERNEHGVYTLSQYGIYKSYLETMQKLVYFYCSKIEKIKERRF